MTRAQTALETIKLSEIKAVWESFSGWYWFATELHEDRTAFGLVRGHETEWGYFCLDELEDLMATGKVWTVPPKNWAICPCVVDDGAVSYSHGGGKRYTGDSPYSPTRHCGNALSWTDSPITEPPKGGTSYSYSPTGGFGSLALGSERERQINKPEGQSRVSRIDDLTARLWGERTKNSLEIPARHLPSMKFQRTNVARSAHQTQGQAECNAVFAGVRSGKRDERRQTKTTMNTNQNENHEKNGGYWRTRCEVFDEQSAQILAEKINAFGEKRFTIGTQIFRDGGDWVCFVFYKVKP